ncbi:MAG: GpE family phage tail protein [Aeromonas popoffii]
MEADIYMVFTGWSPKDTGEMELEEIHHWHQTALRRHNESQQG